MLSLNLVHPYPDTRILSIVPDLVAVVQLYFKATVPVLLNLVPVPVTSSVIVICGEYSRTYTGTSKHYNSST